MSKLTKLTKKLRQEAELEALNNDTFDRLLLAKTFHVRERTIRRDLNEIAERDGSLEDKIKILRSKCLGKLTKKVHNNKLSDKLMVAIVVATEPKKIETKGEFTQTQRVLHLHLWKPEQVEPT
jgi:hypothetical protein